MPQGKLIRKIYTSKGLTPPKGKGEHTRRFHEMASSIMKSMAKNGLTEEEKRIAYAKTMKHFGRNKSVNKSHWKS